LLAGGKQPCPYSEGEIRSPAAYCGVLRRNHEKDSLPPLEPEKECNEIASDIKGGNKEIRNDYLIRLVIPASVVQQVYCAKPIDCPLS